jgi:PAS domain S-box-containing protein
VLVVAAIFPLFGLSVIKAVLSTDAAVASTTKNLEFVASLVAANQEGVVDSARQLLTALSGMPELAEGRPGCKPYLKALVRKLPLYANVGIAGFDGHTRCNSLDSEIVVFMGDRPYFKKALAQRAFVASGYQIGRVSKKATVGFAQPVLDRHGEVTGVAFALMDLREFAKAVNIAQLPKAGQLLVMDREGIVLAANPETSSVLGERVATPLLQAAIKTGSEGVLDGSDRTGTRRLYAFMPSDNSPVPSSFIAVSVQRAEALAPARRQLLIEFLALTLVTAMGGWLAWILGGRAIVRPTASILEATRQIETGRLEVRVPIPSTGPSSELTRIAGGINTMADALEQRERELASELENSRKANAELEQLQAEQATSYADLRETQRKLVEAQRLGLIGRWELDLESRQLTLSNELLELFGMAPGAFDGDPESFVGMIHPDDRAHYRQRRDAVHLEHSQLDIEYRIVTSEGAVRWMHQVGNVHLDERGRTDYRAGLVQDITARKASELAISRNTELLNRTGEMARIGGWELMLDRMAFVCSEEVYRIHELPPAADVALELALGFYAPEAQPALRLAIQRAIELGEPCDLILPFFTAAGRRIQVRFQARAIRQNGKTVRLAGALQDVTEQQEAQAHLKLLELAVSRLNDIVLITRAGPSEDSGIRIVFVNDAFESLTGYSREEVLGKSPGLLQGPKTRGAELDRVNAALRNWQPVRAELINYTKTGQEYWIELDIVPIDANGRHMHFVSVVRDITERKLAEQALVESEQRYAALFESAPVPMYIVDAQTHRFMAVNADCIERYGWTHEEFLNMTLFDIRSAAEGKRLKAELPKGQEKIVSRRLHRRKDGTEFDVQIVSRIVQYAGTVARFVVVLDITAQVKAEKEVQDYLFTLQRAADAVQAITWHQTLDGMMQEVAQQARGVIGAHQAVVSLTFGNFWEQALTALSLSDKYEQYEGLTEPRSGSGIYAMVMEGGRIVRMTQTELEAHPRWRSFGNYAGKHPPMRGWLAVPLKGRSGETIGLLQLSDKYEGEFTLQDEYVAIELAQMAAIAIENVQLLDQVNQLNTGLERKVAERTVALARQEALFRALAEQAPQVVWTVDSRGDATYFNRAWYELVGGELEDWTGTKWLKALHPDDAQEVKENWRNSSANNSLFEGTRRLLAADGTSHTMAYRASAVLDENGEVAFWIGIDADITEFKNIEAALRLSNQELEAFSYSVSHDLRSPLNTIDGFSRLLAKHLNGETGVKGKHYLERIQAGVAQMGKLIEDLLSLAQVSRMQLRYETVDLSALSLRILGEWHGRQPDRQVEVDVEGGLSAQGDPRLVRVLMENLLGNAWKFTSQKADACIRLRKTLDAAGLAVFSVQDNGAGFDMAYADKLFVAFQRLHTASDFPGTGIGLATAGRVIGRHGGKLWAEARPEHGATFFFTLPNVALT